MNPANINEYYSYVLLYVDDVLCIHHDDESTIRMIDIYFTMKEGSIGDLDIYLGANYTKQVCSMELRLGPQALPSMLQKP